MSYFCFELPYGVANENNAVRLVILRFQYPKFILHFTAQVAPNGYVGCVLTLYPVYSGGSTIL